MILFRNKIPYNLAVLSSSFRLWSDNVNWNSCISYASHWYRGGRGFESRWSPVFSVFFFFPIASIGKFNLLRWSFSTFLYHRSSHMNYFINTSRQNKLCGKKTYPLLNNRVKEHPLIKIVSLHPVSTWWILAKRMFLSQKASRSNVTIEIRLRKHSVEIKIRAQN